MDDDIGRRTGYCNMRGHGKQLARLLQKSLNQEMPMRTQCCVESVQTRPAISLSRPKVQNMQYIDVWAPARPSTGMNDVPSPFCGGGNDLRDLAGLKSAAVHTKGSRWRRLAALSSTAAVRSQPANRRCYTREITHNEEMDEGKRERGTDRWLTLLHVLRRRPPTWHVHMPIC